ncbi:MAG: DivIVA domain-containing protein [Chloroherpetonaceae bacterium]|nr:DivIVA domain-containing protein [Chloroherpetonaceae bacterium]
MAIRLTPIEIKKHEFRKAMMGGIDPLEVSSFLDTLSKQWESLLIELEDEKKKNAQQDAEIRRYREVEQMLQQALLQAQQSSAATIENARKEAENILKEASLKSKELEDDAKQKVFKLSLENEKLIQKKFETLTKLKIFLQSELEVLQTFSNNEELFATSPHKVKPREKSEQGNGPVTTASHLENLPATSNVENQLYETSSQKKETSFFSTQTPIPVSQTEQKKGASESGEFGATTASIINQEKVRLEQFSPKPEKNEEPPKPSSRKLSLDDILNELD